MNPLGSRVYIYQCTVYGKYRVHETVKWYLGEAIYKNLESRIIYRIKSQFLQSKRKKTIKKEKEQTIATHNNLE